MSRRYDNLIGVGDGLLTYATIIKVVGILCGVGSRVVAAMVGGKFGLFALLVGVVAGITMVAAAMVIAAFGESMHALADIATNTAARSE